MTDQTTTISQLTNAVVELVKRKGWGDENGVQNPQHVAMAMTVEMSELLEKFQWLTPDKVEGLLRGEDPKRTAEIGEEFADVMMYGLQLMRCLNIDISSEIERKIGIVLDRPNGVRGRYVNLAEVNNDDIR